MSNIRKRVCVPRKCNDSNAGCYGTELKNHIDKCKEIFQEIKKGKLLYLNAERVISEDGINNMFIEELSLNDIPYIRISLLTEEIIDYDLETFGSEDRTEILDKYRPYFVSFIVPLEDNNLRDIESLGDSWYVGKFIQEESAAAEEGTLLEGVLETSASPVNYLKGKLLVFTNRAMKKSVLDRINNTYSPWRFSCASSSDVEKVLNDAWNDDVPATIDIYNVGHGNADYIRGSNHRILYDIGYSYHCYPKRRKSKYWRAVNALRHLQPSCVVLSHWDLDHIIGCAYACQDIFSKKWVAPYLVSSRDKKATPNSIRLAHYLKALGNLYLVDRDQKNKLIATIHCANGTEIKVWLGSGTSRMISVKNIEGLTLEIVDKTKNIKGSHILLAGDVPYKCMNNSLGEPIDFMHVPHHCSKMELNRLMSLPGKGKCAIISTNRNKSGVVNGDVGHRTELECKFKNVINTIDHPSGDDTANLSIQISCWSGTYGFR